MTRRSLFAVLAALPFFGVRVKSDYQPVGFVDIDRWFTEFGPDFYVTLNGRDITYGCVWFNDRTGEACLLHRDSAGYAMVDGNDEVMRDSVLGEIRVVRR